MSDPTLAYSILAGIIAVILAAIIYLQSTVSKEVEEEKPEAAVVRRGQAGNRAAANQNARARLRAVLAERRGEDPAALEDDVDEQPAAAAVPRHRDSGDEGDSEDELTLPKGKIGKKKAAKLEAKAEKRAQRLAEEREREEKKEQDAIKAEEEKQREEEEEAEEAKRLEEEKRLQEERERKEQEEYEKMKSMFTVEDSGFDQNADDESERDLLKEFVDYIKREKVVVLEELAALFRLKTQAVINRVVDLQENGTLTGVLDDRGKFIYISMTELEGIAQFVRQRGRVTLAELAEASGSLVSLTPESQELASQA